MRIIYIILLLITLAGCKEQSEITDSSVSSQSLLESKGYHIVSDEGRVDSYELTKLKIVELPYMMNWGVQSVDPAQYFGKTIHVQKFIVSNHPLSKDRVDVYVYEADGKPIGGTSYPHGDEISLGPGWSLNGKTLEEVHNKSYQDWSSEWLNKYKN